jgi:hypothetical protein
MQPNITPKNKRRVTVAPVTTMEEVPVLTSAERAEFIDSLEIAQAQINAGDFLEYEAEAFKDWLFDAYRGGNKEK